MAVRRRKDLPCSQPWTARRMPKPTPSTEMLAGLEKSRESDTQPIAFHKVTTLIQSPEQETSRPLGAGHYAGKPHLPSSKALRRLCHRGPSEVPFAPPTCEACGEPLAAGPSPSPHRGLRPARRPQNNTQKDRAVGPLTIIVVLLTMIIIIIIIIIIIVIRIIIIIKIIIIIGKLANAWPILASDRPKSRWQDLTSPTSGVGTTKEACSQHCRNWVGGQLRPASTEICTTASVAHDLTAFEHRAYKTPTANRGQTPCCSRRGRPIGLHSCAHLGTDA